MLEKVVLNLSRLPFSKHFNPLAKISISNFKLNRSSSNNHQTMTISHNNKLLKVSCSPNNNFSHNNNSSSPNTPHSSLISCPRLKPNKVRSIITPPYKRRSINNRLNYNNRTYWGSKRSNKRHSKQFFNNNSSSIFKVCPHPLKINNNRRILILTLQRMLPLI